MRKRTTRQRQPAQRVEALPFIERMKDATWREEHARLTADGYTLDQFIKTKVDRRTLKAYCRLVWRKVERNSDGGKLTRSFTHRFTVDLRTHGR